MIAASALLAPYWLRRAVTVPSCAAAANVKCFPINTSVIQVGEYFPVLRKVSLQQPVSPQCVLDFTWSGVQLVQETYGEFMWYRNETAAIPQFRFESKWDFSTVFYVHLQFPETWRLIVLTYDLLTDPRRSSIINITSFLTLYLCHLTSWVRFCQGSLHFTYTTPPLFWTLDMQLGVCMCVCVCKIFLM